MSTTTTPAPPAEPPAPRKSTLRAAWEALPGNERGLIEEDVKRDNPGLARWKNLFEPLCLALLAKRLGIELSDDDEDAGPTPAHQTPSARLMRLVGDTIRPAEEREDWEKELPDLGGHGNAEPFPLDVLPPALADLARETSTYLPCPIDFFAVPALVVAGAGIGRSVALAVKESWIESPLLYAVMVGQPGTTKSPALRIAASPVWELAGEMKFKYELDKLEAERLKGEADERKKAYRKEGLSAPRGDEIPDPVLTRIVMVNATCEAIGPILAENPRGMVMIHDELSGWINSMNQYKGGKGDDRQFWLSIWNGSPICIDRVRHENREPTMVYNPFLGVTGMMCPDMLGDISDDELKDGFLDRILMSYPAEVKVAWTWDSVSKDATKKWSVAFRRLWSRKVTTDAIGREQPHYVRFTPDALNRFAAWYDLHCAEVEAVDFPSHLRGPWAKLRAYCARIALILDQLDWAYGPLDDKPNTPPRDVGLKALEDAITLIAYFKAHLKSVLTTISSPTREDNPDARAILAWAIKRGEPAFSERDALNNFRRRFQTRTEDFPRALEWLKGRRAVRKIPARETGGPGRKPKDSYQIHPTLTREAPSKCI
jgi:hypothetical protein